MLTATLVALAAAASSQPIIVCSSENIVGGRKSLFLTEPFVAPGASDEQIEAAFKAYLGQQYDIPHAFAGCSPYETLSSAQSAIEFNQSAAPGRSSSVVMVRFGSPASAESEAPAKKGSNRAAAQRSSDPPPDAPIRHKKTNAQADAEFAAAKAEYHRKIAEQEADYKAAQEAVEQKKAEQRQVAQQALATYQQQLQAHGQAVAEQQRQADAAQLEYQKLAAKPAGVPNVVYRGFSGPNCDYARLSATNGAGTSSGTKFKEVRTEMAAGTCIVQGWWWDTQRSGASRQ